MININFTKKSSELVSFRVNGHAEYYDRQEKVTVYDDVVCGCVSNLAQVTILGLVEVLKLNATYVADEGDIQLDISNLLHSEIESAQVLLETMLLGLQNLEISYGKYLKVLVEEVQ
ncbi:MULTISPECIES: ribosomal-processing cysteine protease Prp [Clostridium]|uniref:Ribosomal processing cysteine protease Prp n=1 Tax=Clostridium senegalense TaxID=1465809 RepID=A0A6M0GY46_9CLOT|nr:MULTISPECIES: ribosomal-processing cysteine protease Prp [Clostridium]NEU03385.1 ribosomal-processing cysteine protease Prp [Clostridium senegalense]